MKWQNTSRSAEEARSSNEELCACGSAPASPAEAKSPSTADERSMVVPNQNSERLWPCGELCLVRGAVVALTLILRCQQPPYIQETTDGQSSASTRTKSKSGPCRGASLSCDPRSDSTYHSSSCHRVWRLQTPFALHLLILIINRA